MVYPLETSAGYEGDKVVWTLCEPGGGDMVVQFPDCLSSEQQEQWAKRIERALALLQCVDDHTFIYGARD